MGLLKFILMLAGVMFVLLLVASYFKRSPFIFGKMPLDFSIKLKNSAVNIPFGTSVAICFVINGVIFLTHIFMQ